jgi:phage major head subunit gpT-like protein
MTTRTGNFSYLLAPGLRKVFFDQYKALPSEYDHIFNINTSTRNYEDDLEITMLGGTFPSKDEGVSITYVDPKQGNTKRYTHKSFGMGFRVTHEMWSDDLYGPMKKMSQGLAKAAKNTVEVQAIGVVDDASSGSTYTGFDGYPLAYTAHTILYTGGTYANRPTTYGVLGLTTLQAAIIRMEKTPDQDGVLCLIKPKLLIVPPDLRFVAKEILKSEYKPYVANNEINPLADEGLSYFVSHYMSSTTMWCLIGDTHDLNFFWREKTVFENSDDFDTGDAKFKAYHRHSQGFGDWRGFDLGNT